MNKNPFGLVNPDHPIEPLMPEKGSFYDFEPGWVAVAMKCFPREEIAEAGRRWFTVMTTFRKPHPN
jgi:hypothetical protein